MAAVRRVIVLGINFEYPNRGSVKCKFLSNASPNSTACTRDDGGFSVESETGFFVKGVCQWRFPLNRPRSTEFVFAGAGCNRQNRCAVPPNTESRISGSNPAR